MAGRVASLILNLQWPQPVVMLEDMSIRRAQR